MHYVPFLVHLTLKGSDMRKLEVKFYCTKTGTEPVREWLSGLNREDKRIIGEDIKTVQFGWPLGMPLVGSMGDSLWEIRSKLSGGRIARVFFFMMSSTMVLVHGFFKKTQNTPKSELDLAKKRMSEFERAMN